MLSQACVPSRSATKICKALQVVWRKGKVDIVSGMAARAEQIAAHLVALETGAVVTRHDCGGRQGAVDFLILWPDGRQGGLEVTLITEPRSAAWQGMAAKEGWRWPAGTSWEFRAGLVSFPYRRTRGAVLRAVELCDLWSVDDPTALPAKALVNEHELRWFLSDQVGTLRRASLSPGVALYQDVRAEFIDAAPPDFSLVVEGWLRLPHMAPHLEKVRNAMGLDEKHLFLVPVDEMLPARYFTDDFAPPHRAPVGYDELDGLWVWSNFWHRYLVCRDRTWTWVSFSAPDAGNVG